MCTVSVIPPLAGRGLRLAVNRDERRTRALAWGPRLTSRSDVPVLSPIDGDALGTWVAATGAGLVWSLLNVNCGGSLLARAARASRGKVIPSLAGAGDLADARRRFARLDVEPYPPFRLLCASAAARIIWQWNGQQATVDERPLHGAEILSSSSLGDHLVEAPREELFRSLLAHYRDPWRAQDHLHQHAWPDRRHLSVLMSRPLARTVSRTVVVVNDVSSTMTYAPIVDGWVGPVVTASVAHVRNAVAV